MQRLLVVLAAVAILSAATVVLKARNALVHTTLTQARRWGLAALAAWSLAWLFADALGTASEGIADQLWSAAAILALAPFVSILGARRPASKVWSWFVVLPVTVVLALPAATAWNRELRPAPLRWEAPVLAGYFLVLLMGLGNHFGTRFSLAAILYAAACLTVAARLADWLRLDRATTECAATILLGLSAGAAGLAARRVGASARGRPGVPGFRLEPVWSDFRDFFGIVWARRVLERFNESAVREGLPLRLRLHGFVPLGGPAADGTAAEISLTASQQAEAERVLRWLLRRFVDPEWIDERLGSGNSQAASAD
jgi:hypothetical protein